MESNLLKLSLIQFVQLCDCNDEVLCGSYVLGMTLV